MPDLLISSSWARLARKYPLSWRRSVPTEAQGFVGQLVDRLVTSVVTAWARTTVGAANRERLRRAKPLLRQR